MSDVLLDHYQKAVNNQELVFDDCQWQALQILQSIYDKLIKRHTSWWRRFWFREPIMGAYLFGPVGSGKTYLLDLFFHSLPLKNKKRVHFHRFMAWVHDQIAQSSARQDPLKALAKEYAKECCLLCFDEFYVTNIADAMVLGELLQGLYEEGVTTIMSSNVVPHRLYEGGLNRDRFLPTIELIKSQHHVVEVNNQIDYRQTTSDQSACDNRYYYPITEQNRQAIEQVFEQIAVGKIEYNCQVKVKGRSVKCCTRSENSIMFDFKTLCSIPRSQRDYLVLAQHYKHWFIINIPAINRREHTLVCNFIKLIDILYDKGNDLWVLADVAIEQLYPKGKYRFAFRRTQSRLQAMQNTKG